MQKQVIYIRIPRCAGTSMKFFFKKLGIYNRVGKDRFRYKKPFIDFYCDDLETNLNNKEKLGKIWDASYKFAIIRNPVTKFFSAFYYCKKIDETLKNISINEYVENFDNLHLSAFVQKHLVRLQTNHLIQDCDKLIKIENLRKEFPFILNLLDIEKTKIKKYNYVRYEIPSKIDKNIENFIKQYYFDDFVKLNYTYNY